jgi:transcriptional regulator with XRE-family HTH domain
MGTKLKKIRALRKLTQTDLARQMISNRPEGYTFQTVSAYEQPGAVLSADFMEAAAKVLGVSPADLLGEDLEFLQEQKQEYRSEFKVEILTDSQIDGLFKDLIERLNSTRGFDRRNILQAIRAIALEMERRIE